MYIYITCRAKYESQPECKITTFGYTSSPMSVIVYHYLVSKVSTHDYNPANLEFGNNHLFTKLGKFLSWKHFVSGDEVMNETVSK